MDTINAIKNDTLLQNSMNELYGELSGQMQEALERAFLSPDKYTFKEMKTELQKIIKAKESRVELIARNEIGNVVRQARINGYTEDDPNSKFQWIGPDDHRTTSWCKKIAQRTKNGVSLEKLKQIIKEEGDQNIYREDRPFTPHISCRHTVIRKI